MGTLIRTLLPSLAAALFLGSANASSLSQFVVTPNAAIENYNREVLSNITLEACARACLKKSWCQSFDHERAASKCALSDQRVSATLRLKRDYPRNPHDHYSRVVPGKAGATLGNKHVLLIGTDGIRGDALECKGCGTYPTFQDLIKGGAFHNSVWAGGVPMLRQETLSGPGWSSVLTGHWRDEHGVHDWWPKSSNSVALTMRKPHVFDLLKAGFPSSTNVVVADWTNLVKNIKPLTASSLTENAKYAEGSGAKNPTVKKVVEILQQAEAPTAILAHIGIADTHYDYSPTSDIYKKVIAEVDARIKAILDALTKRSTFAQEDWLIVLASDHGGTAYQPATEKKKEVLGGHGQQSDVERRSYLILNSTYGKANAKSYCSGRLMATEASPTNWPRSFYQIDGATPHILDFFGLPNPTEGRKHPACGNS